MVLVARRSKGPFGHDDIIIDMAPMSEVDLVENLHLIVTNPAWKFNNLVKILAKAEMDVSFYFSGCKQS